MKAPPLARIVQTLKQSARPDAHAGEPDRDLLTRFVRQGDEAAFRTLVARHGKSVLAACRQVLADPADADDAFQATFLMLLKKAKRLDASAPLGGWLFAVAHRIAVRCRSDNHRRQSREAEAARRKRVATELPDLSWREAVAVLHDELNALPDKYRLPLLLCTVQGLTRDEAAEQLGSTVGAIRGQLERGRGLLERRLTKRGIVLSAGLLGVLVGNSRAAVGPSAELINMTVQAVGGNATPAVAALTCGAFPMTTLWKQTLVSAVLVFGLIGAGLAVGTQPPIAVAEEQPRPTKTSNTPEPPAKPDTEQQPKPPEPKDRTITGKVLDADGKPIQAELQFIPLEGTAKSLGKTNPDGTFSVTVPLKEPGAWLIAKAEGHGFDFMMPGTNTPKDVKFRLPKDVPIRGRIIDPQGMPVAGVTVEVRHMSEYGDGTIQPFLDAWKKRTNFRQSGAALRRRCQSGSTPLFAAKTDKDGRFELTGVGAERLLECRVKGAGRARTDVFIVTRAGFDPKPFNDVTLSLRPTTSPENLSWSFNPLLNAPEFTTAVEPEKLIRGTVTDAASGKPRVGATVRLRQDDGLRMYSLSATTDADGKYLIRGARKWQTYTVKTAIDSEKGYLPSSIELLDTAGYEPVAADIPCVKGVIVTGTLRDKATGKPIAGYIDTEVLAGNEFAKKQPVLGKYPQFEREFVNADGKYRRVILPGPMLLAAGTTAGPRADEYQLPKADPMYPDKFHREFDILGYYGPGGVMGFVNGNWCKVIDAKPTDDVITQDIAFERGLVRKVKVTDDKGMPVNGVNATGYHGAAHMYARSVGDSDTIRVLHVEPGQDRFVAAIHKEKKLVGSLVFRDTDKNPTLKLGPGGTVTGRALDENGKPLAKIGVYLHFTRRQAEELYGGYENRRRIATDADGNFAFDMVLPGEEFRLQFVNGKTTRFGPEYQKAPKHTLAQHGDTLKLGDLKLERHEEE